MSGSKDPEVRLLESLGHRFESRALLLEALTHRSFVNECEPPPGDPPVKDNERLEWLGDAVLDLVVSLALMARYPSAQEGELSRMRAAIVNEQGLARLARAIELGPALRLGRGEERSGGRERFSLLADAFEALIGAVYLDGGLAAVERVLEPHLDLEGGERLAGWDAKTELQQRLQAERKVAPHYRLVSADGPGHEQEFRVEAVFEDRVLAAGLGRSKKQAEQAAAAAALARLEAEGIDRLLAVRDDDGSLG